MFAWLVLILTSGNSQACICNYNMNDFENDVECKIVLQANGLCLWCDYMTQISSWSAGLSSSVYPRLLHQRTSMSSVDVVTFL